jgi:tetratricopeptide (TPR) repeat protein
VQGRKDIYIDGEKLLSVDWTSDGFDNTAENAYYVAGALSKAFHDHDTVEEWQFRADGKGGVTCLTADRVNGVLHEFLQKNGNGARLQEMVTKAYRVEKATGFREKMKLAEGKRLAELQQARAEALAAGTKAVKKMRENADTYSDFGFGKEALFQMERTFAAEKQAGEAENYAIRGRAKAVAGDYEGALLDADKAVSLDNRNIYNFLNRADVRHMRGEREAALADCESAKALDGKNPVTYLLAAQIYEEMGNAEQALDHYKELHRLAPRAFRKIPEEYLQEISEKDYKELQKEKEEAKKAREEKEKRG